MARYVLRVFRDNVTGWVPTILVVAVVTTLVGICMNQFVWTSSPSFTLAARQAGSAWCRSRSMWWCHYSRSSR